VLAVLIKEEKDIKVVFGALEQSLDLATLALLLKRIGNA